MQKESELNNEMTEILSAEMAVLKHVLLREIIHAQEEVQLQRIHESLFEEMENQLVQTQPCEMMAIIILATDAVLIARLKMDLSEQGPHQQPQTSEPTFEVMDSRSRMNEMMET